MLAVMIIIFIFSGQTEGASSEFSNRVGGNLYWGILGIEIPNGQTASGVVIFAGLTIRSLAHIFLYMLLGLTSFCFMKSLLALRGKWRKRDLIYGVLGALVISFLYACLDEFHQMFVDGRTSTFRDVGDAVGFSLAIAVAALVALSIDYTGEKRGAVKSESSTDAGGEDSDGT